VRRGDTKNAKTGGGEGEVGGASPGWAKREKKAGREEDKKVLEGPALTKRRKVLEAMESLKKRVTLLLVPSRGGKSDGEGEAKEEAEKGRRLTQKLPGGESSARRKRGTLRSGDWQIRSKDKKTNGVIALKEVESTSIGCSGVERMKSERKSHKKEMPSVRGGEKLIKRELLRETIFLWRRASPTRRGEVGQTNEVIANSRSRKN